MILPHSQCGFDDQMRLGPDSMIQLVKLYTDMPESIYRWVFESPLTQRPSASYRTSLQLPIGRPCILSFLVTLSPGFSARRLSWEEAEKPWELLSVMKR